MCEAIEQPFGVVSIVRQKNGVLYVVEIPMKKVRFWGFDANWLLLDYTVCL